MQDVDAAFVERKAEDAKGLTFSGALFGQPQRLTCSVCLTEWKHAICDALLSCHIEEDKLLKKKKKGQKGS